ncbi:hypothetical protein BDV93DRAFT_516677 [Ceratobasidium sp. AG-I]|nr:hypothetical protein BDV93DRAFT_516677 [Ceratobasidium sp. AG-I]
MLWFLFPLPLLFLLSPLFLLFLLSLLLLLFLLANPISYALEAPLALCPSFPPSSLLCIWGQCPARWLSSGWVAGLVAWWPFVDWWLSGGKIETSAVESGKPPDVEGAESEVK